MTAGLRLLLVGLGRTEHAVEAALAATALDPAPRRVAVPAAEGLTPLTEATSWPAPDAVLLHGPSLVDGDLRRAVINHLHAAWPEAPVLVVHGGAAASFAASAMEEGAADVVPAFGGHLAAAILLRSRQAMDDGLRRRAEQETRSGHERFRRILDEVDEGIAVLGPTGDVHVSNDAARRLLDLDRLGGSLERIALCDDRGIFVPFHQTPIGRVLAEGGMARETLSVTTDGGQPRWLDIRVRALPSAIERGAALVVVADVTQARVADERHADLERQLQHTQRLHTLGEMAGGIAHDFNNILAPIQGYLDLVIGRADVDGPLIADLKQIGVGVARAQDLVRQIATFGGHGEIERRRVDVAAVAAEALGLLRASLPSSIEIRHRKGSGKTEIRADATQVHQVVVNLCTNAGRAMSSGGLLTVSVDAVDVREPVSGRGDDIEPGPWVRLRVADTGCGMAQDVLERIFEPYFTTRLGGKGSGLGLSVVHGIVQQHGGGIRVRSAVGKGACFDVYLPALGDGPPEENGAVASDEARGSERILLVDDEPAIVDSLGRGLQELGYDVDTAVSAPHALAKARNAPGSYHVLVTDHTMPRMTGLALATEVREWQPEMRVLLVTGYAGGLERQVLADAGVDALMSKPVRAHDLGRAIRQALGRPPAGGANGVRSET
ncbi:MAG: ATP-binding protein [Planctomycetota bacterium]